MEGGPLAFVVHKHRATSLHYDFRLEIGGVMPSWSVPKGPTLDPRAKRLAMPTGPHELEYRRFEGMIPRGGYGGGPVMIWDQGTYSPEVETRKGARTAVPARTEAERVAAEGMAKGELKFILYGTKLHGSFALVRTRGIGGKEAWLLIKHSDEFASEGYDANAFGRSAVSGRTIEEIAGEGTLPLTDEEHR